MEINKIYGPKFFQYAIIMNVVLLLSYFVIFAFSETSVKKKYTPK